MRFRTPLLTFVSVCLLAGTTPVVPALADPTTDQLYQLKLQEQSQRAALDQLASQQQSAQTALARIQADYSGKQADYQKALSQAEALSKQVTAMDSRQKELQRQHDERINRFRTQSRTLYKAGPAEALVFLFGAGTFSEFLDRLFYITAITRDNFEQAQRLRDERQSLLADKARTAKLRADLDPLLAQLAAKAAEAAGQLNQQATVESQIEGQQRGQLTALLGNQRLQKQLEAALAAAQAAAAAAAKKGGGLSIRGCLPDSTSRADKFLRPRLWARRRPGPVRRLRDGRGRDGLAADHPQLLQWGDHRRGAGPDRPCVPDPGRGQHHSAVHGGDDPGRRRHQHGLGRRRPDGGLLSKR